MSVDRIMERLRERQAAAQEAAGEYLVKKCKEKIGSLFPPASSPGSPPHKRTGELQSSIYYIVQGDTVRVGSYAPYASDLEFGTQNMAARPFLASTALEEQAAIRHIFTHD